MVSPVLLCFQKSEGLSPVQILHNGYGGAAHGVEREWRAVQLTLGQVIDSRRLLFCDRTNRQHGLFSAFAAFDGVICFPPSPKRKTSQVISLHNQCTAWTKHQSSCTRSARTGSRQLRQIKAQRYSWVQCRSSDISKCMQWWCWHSAMLGGGV